MDRDSEKMLLEVLRMARELVINEHTDRRAQLHNAWLYESEQAWKTCRIKLKYPDIPPYPTEQDFLERAQTLLKFLVIGNNEPTVLPKATPPVIQQELLSQEKNAPEETVVKSTDKEDSRKGILPSVLKRIEKLRNKT